MANSIAKGSLALLVGASMLVTIGVEGHGYMLDPPMRSSMWRVDNRNRFPTAPVNNNDNQLFCGGSSVSIHS